MELAHTTTIFTHGQLGAMLMLFSNGDLTSGKGYQMATSADDWSSIGIYRRYTRLAQLI